MGIWHNKRHPRNRIFGRVDSIAILSGCSSKYSALAAVSSHLSHAPYDGDKAGSGLGCFPSHVSCSTYMGYHSLCGHSIILQPGGQGPSDWRRLIVRTIGEYLRLYFLIEAQYIKGRMQYRTDFIVSSIGMFVSSL